ncbi:hypothetical protein [Paracandidimonas soli]|uniref:Uncharacterized protein n=1 Tax=Paracandidimonas soli TaxID=1917182 RepID=A0A4R3UTX9_9BURK|nr:hypothetical protein [Paracandidimonas soli]TCU93918.1 hypothetical protein EV686_11086 [Paracandidimonas soli]
MKLNAKWIIGIAARVLIMGPLMLARDACEIALRWLNRRLPGG